MRVTAPLTTDLLICKCLLFHRFLVNNRGHQWHGRGAVYTSTLTIATSASLYIWYNLLLIQRFIRVEILLNSNRNIGDTMVRKVCFTFTVKKKNKFLEEICYCLSTRRKRTKLEDNLSSKNVAKTMITR